MREWVVANDLPIITIATKMDYIPRSKVQSVLAKIRKQFGGEVFPFSATEMRYTEDILNYFLEV